MCDEDMRQDGRIAVNFGRCGAQRARAWNGDGETRNGRSSGRGQRRRDVNNRIGAAYGTIPTTSVRYSEAWMEEKDEWVTVGEAAKWSGYNADYLRDLIGEGKIVAVKKEGRWKVSCQSLRAYMQQAEERGDKRWGPKDE